MSKPGAQEDRDNFKPWQLEFRSSRGFIIAVIAIAVFTDIFIYGMIIPILPVVLRQRTNLPDEELQRWTSILLAAFGGATLIGAPIFGYFADKGTSRQAPFIVGLLALAGSTAMFWVARSTYSLVIARILQGLSGAAVWTVGTALIVDTMGQDQVGAALGYVSMAMTVGTVSGPSLGGVILDKAGYHAVFSVAIALIAVDIILRLLMIEQRTAAKWMCENTNGESERLLSNSGEGNSVNYQATSESYDEGSLPPENNQKYPYPQQAAGESVSYGRTGHLPPIVRLLGSGSLLVILAAGVVNAITSNAFDTVLPLFLMKTFHWGPLGVGLCFLPLFIPSFLSPIIGRVIDRKGPRMPAVLGLLLSLPVFLLLRLITGDSMSQRVLLVALLLLAGLAMIVQMVALMVEVSQFIERKEKECPGIFGRQGGTAQAYALFNMAWAGGQLLGPLISGGLAETAGWAVMVTVLGAISGMTGVLLGCTDEKILQMLRRRRETS